MKNLFAAFFYGYFYFFSFSAKKVKVLFAANHGSTTFACEKRDRIQACGEKHFTAGLFLWPDGGAPHKKERNEVL